ARDQDGLPGGLRPDRLADADRPPLPAALAPLPAPVGGAEALLPERRRRREAALSAETRPFVFATVGTDHHPFHRLVRWLDDWYALDGASRTRCLIQTGTSEPP